MSKSHDDAQAMLAFRAQLPSAGRARKRRLTFLPTNLKCTQSRLQFRQTAILGELQRAAACECKTNCRVSKKKTGA